MCRGFTFIGKVGSQNNFGDHTVECASHELLKTKLTSTNTIKRRDSPHQYVIETLIGLSLLHHVHINGRLNNAKQRSVTMSRDTSLTDICLGEGITAPTSSDSLQRMLHRITKPLSALPIILQKVISHALSRFWPDPRQTTQRLNQRLKTGRVHLEGELETWRQIKPCREP